MTEALLLDRDGTIHRDVGYTVDISNIEWTNGFLDLTRACKTHKVKIFVITNQSGVARGYFELKDVERLHDSMAKIVEINGGEISNFYICPHHPSEGTGQYTRVCSCRKPSSGMIERCIKENRLERSRVIMVGDKRSDIRAAELARLKGVFFSGGDIFDFLKPLLNFPTALKT